MISNYEEIDKFRIRCGPADGVMLCQAAMWNPSIFRVEGLLPLSNVSRRFLELVNNFLFESTFHFVVFQSVKFDNCLPNMKYVLQRMYGGREDQIEFHDQILAANTNAEL